MDPVLSVATSASMGDAGLCFDTLPNEILSLVVAGHLPPWWRPMARRVCVRWRDILDDAAKLAAPAGDCISLLDVCCRGTRRHNRVGYRTVSAQNWHKGTVVLASALVECFDVKGARNGPDRPDALVQRWIREWGVPPRCVPALLVASREAALVRHAMTFSNMLSFGPDTGRDIQYSDFDRAFEEGEATRFMFDAGLVDVAINTGDLKTARLLVSLIEPAFCWSRIETLHWICTAFRNERLDTAFFALASWSTATNQHDLPRGLLTTLWLELGQLPVDRLARVLDLMHVTGHNRTTERRNAVRGDTSIGTRNECAGNAHSKPDIDATIDAVVDAVGRAVVDELARCLAHSWHSCGANVCASAAARAGNTQVLALACKSIDAREARAAAAAACRCGHVDAARWCVQTGCLITAREAAFYAAEPYKWGEQYSRSSDHAAVLAWVCDPCGGAYTPSRDDVALMVGTSTRDHSLGRAVWLVRRYPDKVSASDFTRIVSLACRWGIGSMYATMDDLESVVCMFDAVASVNPDACARCDLWAELWSARGRCEGDTLRLLRYAWARTKGVDGHVAARLLGRYTVHAPAPAHMWTRWCRVRPVGAASAYGGADEEEAIRAWFAARGIVPRLS
nr:hypothetical protein [Pandoravirus massiliensis]